LLPTCVGESEKGTGKILKVKNPAKQDAEGMEVLKAPGTQSASVEMPPELCVVLGFSAAVIRSAYWVPSVMHRVKAAVLASQLRRSIQAPKIPVMEVWLLFFSLDSCLLAVSAYMIA